MNKTQCTPGLRVALCARPKRGPILFGVVESVNTKGVVRVGELTTPDGRPTVVTNLRWINRSDPRTLQRVALVSHGRDLYTEEEGRAMLAARLEEEAERVRAERRQMAMARDARAMSDEIADGERVWFSATDGKIKLSLLYDTSEDAWRAARILLPHLPEARP